eukprot:412123-Rhodomonas_salina.5
MSGMVLSVLMSGMMLPGRGSRPLGARSAGVDERAGGAQDEREGSERAATRSARAAEPQEDSSARHEAAHASWPVSREVASHRASWRLAMQCRGVTFGLRVRCMARCLGRRAKYARLASQ